MIIKAIVSHHNHKSSHKENNLHKLDTQHNESAHHQHSADNNECGETDPCISLVPIFNHLEEDQMQEIMVVTSSESYKKGEIIYHAGNNSDTLYIISHGKIKIFSLSQSGKEQLIRILNVGEFTGELALFDETIHQKYAQAMEDTNVCCLKRSNFQEILIKYPLISMKVLSEFSRRLGESERQVTRFATEKVETRIALFLVECLEKDGTSREIKLPMSKKDLASYLGTTPETISRKLYAFENTGLIKQRFHRKIEILDLEGLLII